MKKISKICAETHNLSIKKGWWPVLPCKQKASEELPPTEVNFELVAAKLALIHSEVSEALEAVRHNDIILRIDLETNKPEGFASEMADVIIRTCELSEALGIDLEDAVNIKHEYNKQRAYRHGGKTL